MYIQTLNYEDYSAPSLGGEISNPTWETIRDTIITLNGDTRSELILIRGFDDEFQEHMYIGGGGSNRLYICGINHNNPNQPQWLLINPSPSSTVPIEIMAGQPTTFEPGHCVELTVVLKAAEAYTRFGNRDLSLTWKELD